ncbi:MAG: rhamnogalacturonan acetylesterase [Opitutus sp.]|nr:rhamnogalacturonan acetylesterase [Opitutus sp.]
MKSWRSFRVLAALVLPALLAAADDAPAKPPRVFLIGGSTMSTFDPPNPMRGWGQAFGLCFTDPAMVQNRAASGRSSKSFIDEGRWAAVLAEMSIGDYLVIQFGGGNDGKKEDPKRYTEPRGAYRANLERIVRETRAKGAHPLLATMGAKREWDAAGRFVDPLSEWVEVTRGTARALDVPLLDLRARTVELETNLGPAGSAALRLHLPPGQSANYRNGARDDTHFSEYGATRVAALAAEELRRLGVPLARWLIDKSRSDN